MKIIFIYLIWVFDIYFILGNVLVIFSYLKIEKEGMNIWKKFLRCKKIRERFCMYFIYYRKEICNFLENLNNIVL